MIQNSKKKKKLYAHKHGKIKETAADSCFQYTNPYTLLLFSESSYLCLIYIGQTNNTNSHSYFYSNYEMVEIKAQVAANAIL